MTVRRFAFFRTNLRSLAPVVVVLCLGLVEVVCRADDNMPSSLIKSTSDYDADSDDPPVFDITQLPPTPISDPPTDDDILNQRISQLESELAKMKKRFDFGGMGYGTLNPNAIRDNDISANLYAPPATAPTPANVVYPSVRLTGFFQLDAAAFNQDTTNQHQFGQVQDDIGFRRARLAAVGDVSTNVSYMIEMDFAFPGRPSFMDVFMDVQKVSVLGNVKIGQWRQPFGMDELTSARELTFLERPLMFAFAPFRETGVGFHDNNAEQSVTWAGSVYGYPADAWGNSFGNKQGGSAERITAIPVYMNGGNQVVHFGVDHAFLTAGPAGASFRNTNTYGGVFGSATASSNPGLGTSGGTTNDVPFFVNTNPLAYEYCNLVNGEFAGVCNQFTWQSEIRYAFMQNAMAVPGSAGAISGVEKSITMPSWYARATYFLTGEVRPYNKINGVLGRVTPLNPFGINGGMGAWELAAQYDYIDLNAASPFYVPTKASVGTVGVAGVTPIQYGGAMSNVTLGVNWYLNKFAKIQFDYMLGELDRSGSSSTINTICTRAQLDF